MPPTASRARDRDATQAAILDAAQLLIAEEGFESLGVNAVARRAGCDKQLIYRYFGGLDGLIAAVGEASALKLAAALAPPSDLRPAGYGALVAALLERLLAALRADPLARQLIAAETRPGGAPAAFTAARGRVMAAWLANARAGLAPPEAADAPALNALLIAAVQQIALVGAAGGRFAGLSLESEEDWARLSRALTVLAQAAYR